MKPLHFVTVSLMVLRSVAEFRGGDLPLADAFSALAMLVPEMLTGGSSFTMVDDCPNIDPSFLGPRLRKAGALGDAETMRELPKVLGASFSLSRNSYISHRKLDERSWR